MEDACFFEASPVSNLPFAFHPEPQLVKSSLNHHDCPIVPQSSISLLLLSIVAFPIRKRIKLNLVTYKAHSVECMFQCFPCEIQAITQEPELISHDLTTNYSSSMLFQVLVCVQYFFVVFFMFFSIFPHPKRL